MRDGPALWRSILFGAAAALVIVALSALDGSGDRPRVTEARDSTCVQPEIVSLRQ